MDQHEIQEAIDRYNKRYELYGISEKALGWGEKGRGKLRFEILLSQWSFEGQSVLDFGCGFGDLFEYMVGTGRKCNQYTGVDINSTFIDIAQKKFKTDAQFLVQNMLEDHSGLSVDFVLSSGVFNHKLKDNIGFIEDCFEVFNTVSQKGFAVNFLSDKVDFKHDYTYHADPAEIVKLAYRYSNNIVLRNDYMPYEFTIFINKFSKINSQFTIYDEYLNYV